MISEPIKSDNGQAGAAYLAAEGSEVLRTMGIDRLTYGPNQTMSRRILNGVSGALVRARFQLLGAFVLGVILPALVRWRLDLLGLPTQGNMAAMANTSFQNAIMGTILAQLLGFVAMRQMRNHPGVRSIGYIFYSFTIAYSLIGLTFLFVRADYSRYQILSSYFLTIAWFVVVDYITHRRTIWRLAFLPGMSPTALPRAPRVLWYRLAEPRLGPNGVTGIVADLRSPMSPDWERFLAGCALQGLPVFDVRQVTEWLTGQVKLQHLSENTLSSNLWRTLYARSKRIVDFGIALLAAPVFLTVIALTGLLIRIESRGPALFTQTRMGYRGRTFTIYKLRSMRNDAPTGSHFTVDADPRVTRVGAFIRKYRIDEFPQIFNIIKGDMSWIGPRPEALVLSEWYEREVPFYCYRHMVRPGITGWAQVNQGNVGALDAATEKLHFDFYYIKNLSPWLDLLIGAKTVQTMLTGFGSR